MTVWEWANRERAFLGYDVLEDTDTARRPMPVPQCGAQYTENVDVEEIPFELMKPCEWRTARLGMWEDSSEHITLKEG